jgi:hypothetical protein
MNTNQKPTEAPESDQALLAQLRANLITNQKDLMITSDKLKLNIVLTLCANVSWNSQNVYQCIHATVKESVDCLDFSVLGLNVDDVSVSPLKGESFSQEFTVTSGYSKLQKKFADQGLYFVVFALLEDEIKFEYEQLTWSFIDAQPSESGWMTSTKFKTKPFDTDESIIIINMIYDNSEQTYCSLSKITALKSSLDSNTLIDGPCSTETALNSEVDR